MFVIDYIVYNCSEIRVRRKQFCVKLLMKMCTKIRLKKLLTRNCI